MFFSEPSAIREAARALAFRFGEEMKGLLEEGVLCAGLDKFYGDGAALWQAAGKHSAVLCENFARTVPDAVSYTHLDVYKRQMQRGPFSAYKALAQLICGGS